MIGLVITAVIGFVLAYATMSAEGRRKLRGRVASITVRQGSHRVEPTQRIVMDPNAGYRGAVRVEPVRKEHLVLWTLFLLLVAIAAGVLLFRFG